jgi:hypothetical protein
MPGNPHLNVADPDLVKPGDIVWLDAIHLTPTRGRGGHTWPHYAVCLFHYRDGAVSDVIVSGTIFQFACVSSLTKNNPLDPSKQVRLDHNDPNLGLTRPSVACVDFAPSVEVTVQGGHHVLNGVRRLNRPVPWRVPASPTLQAINVLFVKYWTEVAAASKVPPKE